MAFFSSLDVDGWQDIVHVARDILLGAKLFCTRPVPIHYELEKLEWKRERESFRLVRSFMTSVMTKDDGTVLTTFCERSRFTMASKWLWLLRDCFISMVSVDRGLRDEETEEIM